MATTYEERIALQCRMVALMNDEARILFNGGGRFYAFTRPEVKGVARPYGGAVDVSRSWIEE